MKEKRTAGIILAAGMSRRLGRPKQLIKIGGAYLIERVLDAALGSKLKKIVLVLGHESQTILQALGQKIPAEGVQVVINPDYPKGMSTSFHAGFNLIRDDFPSAMFLVGDQPMIDSKLIDHLLEAFWKSDKGICVPTCRGKRGNPTIFSEALYEYFDGIKGDMGARKLIEAHHTHVLNVEIDDARYLSDIDTHADLERLAKDSS